MSYTLDPSGIYRPPVPVSHRDDEYQESGFELLLQMQSAHFWYLGRHKFLLSGLRRHLAAKHRTAIDLGGGVGGWVKFVLDRTPGRFTELALGDSSDVALMGAKGVLPQGVVDFYQVDLMATQWRERWDVIFLLDVIEHCPDDAAILRQAHQALKPGGLLFVTTPALKCFWSFNDDIAKHLRRYSVADFARLAEATQFRLRDARYFMFFLSPLYWLARKFKPQHMSEAEIDRAVHQERELSSATVNGILSKIFCAESPLGHYVRFPWGTSVLGVFEKT